jgi:hypothetical protein
MSKQLFTIVLLGYALAFYLGGYVGYGRGTKDAWQTLNYIIKDCK